MTETQVQNDGFCTVFNAE